jgi:hypothetical protein
MLLATEFLLESQLTNKMRRLLSQVVALVLALGFIANAQCAAACVLRVDHTATHACCKRGKGTQTKQCANRVQWFKDAVLKGRACAETPEFTAHTASAEAFNPLGQTARASFTPQEHTRAPDPPLALRVLRV